MPSMLHEAPLELLRRNPKLAVALLAGTPGLDIPKDGTAAMAPGDVTAGLPVELRADAVVLVRGKTGKLAVVAESQLSANGIKAKRRVWPAYLTQARAQHDCPAVLMVFCRDRATTRACAKPIATGHPRFILVPIVIGPGTLPGSGRASDADAAAELAMMAAWTGQADLSEPAVQAATLSAIAGLDAERLATYTRIVLIAAPDESSRRALEMLMATVFKNDFLDKLEGEARARGEAEGRARGEALMILQILESRRIAVPDEVRNRVLACADTDVLESWGRKAAVAHSLQEVFGIAGDTASSLS